MRIYSSPVVILVEQKPRVRVGRPGPDRERFRICEVPDGCALLRRAVLPRLGLVNAISSAQIFTEAHDADDDGSSRIEANAVGTVDGHPRLDRAGMLHSRQ
jgi:hypothetical protein